MACAWIHRDEEGIVRGAIMVPYAGLDEIADWKADGLTPELVDFGDAPIAINAPLPSTARVVST